MIGVPINMIAELIEKLCILNIKLFDVCNSKTKMANNPGDFSKIEMAEIMRKDISLCKQRAQLKNAIDKKIRDSIISGDMVATEEVKNYG